MTAFGWWLVELVSHLLEPGERDAVLGDFEESGQSAARALLDVIGLVARRQASLWMNWRPWVALVAPLLLLLTGPPYGEAWLMWVCRQFSPYWKYGVRYQVGLTVTDAVVNFISMSLLLVAWAWIGGVDD